MIPYPSVAKSVAAMLPTPIRPRAIVRPTSQRVIRSTLACRSTSCFSRSSPSRQHPTTALRLPEYQRLRDPQVFEDHLRRIEVGLATDPAAAIASSKEMVESVLPAPP